MSFQQRAAHQMRRAVSRLRDERGSAAASIAFVIIAAVICGALAGIASNIVLVASETQQMASAESAVDARMVDYLSAASSTASPPLDEICYPSLAACASITSIVDGSDQQTITLHSRSQAGGDGITRTRALPHEVTHIAGFDAAGNPVWTTVGGASGFPGSWNAPRQP